MTATEIVAWLDEHTEIGQYRFESDDGTVDVMLVYRDKSGHRDSVTGRTLSDCVRKVIGGEIT